MRTSNVRRAALLVSGLAITTALSLTGCTKSAPVGNTSPGTTGSATNQAVLAPMPTNSGQLCNGGQVDNGEGMCSGTTGSGSTGSGNGSTQGSGTSGNQNNGSSNSGSGSGSSSGSNSSAGSNTNGGSNSGGSNANSPVQVKTTKPAPQSNGNGVVEYVDNHGGVQIFGTPEFGAVTNASSSHAAYGTKLVVSCYVPNTTGQYGSVNGLYQIVGGEGGWAGDYVPANVMLNSATAPLGSTNTPDRDPRVGDC